jgi:hypothetical protein
MEATLELEQEISRELNAGERLLWTGRPRQGVVFRHSDIFLVPFSLLWCGFAIFWEVSVFTSGAPFFFRLWGIPFVLVGLYFVFGRFLVESQQRKKTFYGLSNERVIIVSGLFNRSVKSMNLRTLTDVSLMERSDHSGSITFGQTSSIYSWFGNSSWPGMGQNVPSFDAVENAKDVYQRIRTAQKEAQ